MKTLLLLLVIVLLAACGTAATSTPAPLDIEISVQYEPDPPAVGAGTLLITLSANGSPIDNARVQVQGNMAHAGMTAVNAEANTSENGVYSVPFEWSMGGEWVLTVTAELPDGATASEDFNVTVGAVSSESIINRTPTP
jgi:uncharacterized GH25 family protein